MKLIRESKRAVKALHKNTTLLHDAPLRAGRIVSEQNGSVSYTFDHDSSERYGSRFKLVLTRADLHRLVAAILPGEAA